MTASGDARRGVRAGRGAEVPGYWSQAQAASANPSWVRHRTDFLAAESDTYICNAPREGDGAEPRRAPRQRVRAT